MDKIEKVQKLDSPTIVTNETIKLRKHIDTLPHNSNVILDTKHKLQRLEDEKILE